MTDVRGARVFVTGMGAELGSLVTSRLEAQSWTGPILGVDYDPPRRRLRYAEFHRVHPTDAESIARILIDFQPEYVFHLGVYEPNARASAAEAQEWSPAMAAAVSAASARCPSVRGFVVRSGIEVYGRGNESPDRPDETAPRHATSAFGRQLVEVEDLIAEAAATLGVPAAMMRLAPVMGPHVPSPLGRLLRLPAVPFHLLGNPAFTVIDDRDAADAMVAAAAQTFDGALNVVAPGELTVVGSSRSGGRFPVPLVGPQWCAARQITRVLGAPVPDHVQELLRRGRLADGNALGATLGVHPVWTASQVVDNLHSWPGVTRFLPTDRAHATV